MVKPAGQNRLATKRPGPARENDEHRLRDFLCVMRVGRVTQRNGVNQVDVPVYYLREHLVRFTLPESRQQIIIGHFGHSIVKCAPNCIGDIIFQWELGTPAAASGLGGEAPR